MHSLPLSRPPPPPFLTLYLPRVANTSLTPPRPNLLVIVISDIYRRRYWRSNFCMHYY
ncbi:hypothetical protein PUN28_017227 [Cardiocondyla obscurior]|uniref:Uncharacterized protein n=1 Tax=Cardiocondyla obscurior TaxID=286306 RepID=A0AAW2EKS9_9HYME